MIASFGIILFKTIDNKAYEANKRLIRIPMILFDIFFKRRRKYASHKGRTLKCIEIDTNEIIKNFIQLIFFLKSVNITNNQKERAIPSLI